jgi:hypothetical protein
MTGKKMAFKVPKHGTETCQSEECRAVKESLTTGSSPDRVRTAREN